MRETIKVLVNPFKKGDIVTLPSGTQFISNDPNLSGLEKTKRSMRVTLQGAPAGFVRGNVFVAPRLTVQGAGPYWDSFYLNERIVTMNGHTPEYTDLSIPF